MKEGTELQFERRRERRCSTTKLWRDWHSETDLTSSARETYEPSRRLTHSVRHACCGFQRESPSSPTWLPTPAAHGNALTPPVLSLLALIPSTFTGSGFFLSRAGLAR
jgi:hypothetical protein